MITPKRPTALLCTIGCAAILAGCTPPPRTTAIAVPPGTATASEDGASLEEVTSDRPRTRPEDIILTREDITDRPYKAIADIKVTVSRLYIPDPDPTPAEADRRFRSKAAELGADAVILIRYGSVGVTLTSWGKLEAQGRAVHFVD